MSFKEKVLSLMGKHVYVYTNGPYPLGGMLSEITDTFMILDTPPHRVHRNALIVNLSSVVAVEEFVELI